MEDKSSKELNIDLIKAIKELTKEVQQISSKLDQLINTTLVDKVKQSK